MNFTYLCHVYFCSQPAAIGSEFENNIFPKGNFLHTTLSRFLFQYYYISLDFILTILNDFFFRATMSNEDEESYLEKEISVFNSFLKKKI